MCWRFGHILGDKDPKSSSFTESMKTSGGFYRLVCFLWRSSETLRQESTRSTFSGPAGDKRQHTWWTSEECEHMFTLIVSSKPDEHVGCGKFSLNLSIFSILRNMFGNCSCCVCRFNHLKIEIPHSLRLDLGNPRHYNEGICTKKGITIVKQC